MITSHTIVNTIINGNDKIVEYYLTDDSAIDRSVVKLRVPASTTDTEINNIIISKYADQDLSDAELEANEAIQDAKRGIDPRRTPQYQTLQEFHIRVLLELVTLDEEFPNNKNMRGVDAAYDMYQEADTLAGNSPAQKRAYFGITAEEWGRLDSRYNEAIGHRTYVRDDAGDLFRNKPQSTVI